MRDEAAPLCLQRAAAYDTLDEAIRCCCFKREGHVALEMNLKGLELERLIYYQCQRSILLVYSHASV